MAEIKFCGLTRTEDAAEAERLGASFLGVIFAGGPRTVSEAQARAVLEGRTSARRVGVFASADVPRVLATAHVLGLHVLQIHAEFGAGDVKRIRAATGLEVWPVLRIRNGALPAQAEEVFAEADAVVLDTHVRGMLGGSGKTFNWDATAEALAPVRGDARVVVAGGLTPENVAGAIAALAPDIVDVSSGVESAAGIKDHERMRRFVSAVRGVPAVSP